MTINVAGCRKSRRVGKRNGVCFRGQTGDGGKRWRRPTRPGGGKGTGSALGLNRFLSTSSSREQCSLSFPCSRYEHHILPLNMNGMCWICQWSCLFPSIWIHQKNAVGCLKLLSRNDGYNFDVLNFDVLNLRAVHSPPMLNTVDISLQRLHVWEPLLMKALGSSSSFVSSTSFRSWCWSCWSPSLTRKMHERFTRGFNSSQPSYRDVEVPS